MCSTIRSNGERGRKPRDGSANGDCPSILAPGAALKSSASRAVHRIRPAATSTGIASAGLAALTVTAMLPQQASSQSPSILELLPVAEAPLEIGTERTSMLTASDYATTDGRRVQAFELFGERGQPVTIDAVSEDFDAFLYVVGPGYEEPQVDDDSGGQCHARLSLFLPEAGTFRVVVGSLGGGTGAFTLFVGDRERPMADGECGADPEAEAALLNGLLELEAQATLAVGDTVASSLSTDGPSLPDGSPAEAWLVTGDVGQTVVVDLVSAEFDALLYAAGPALGGYEIDDDSGGACNSRMTLAFDSSEPIRLVATSLDGRPGQYALAVSDRAGPLATGECP